MKDWIQPGKALEMAVSNLYKKCRNIYKIFIKKLFPIEIIGYIFRLLK